MLHKPYTGLQTPSMGNHTHAHARHWSQHVQRMKLKQGTYRNHTLDRTIPAPSNTTWPFSVCLAPAAPSAPPPLPPPPSTAQLHYYAPLSFFLSRARAVLLITLHSRLLLRCDAAALATTCDTPKTEQKNDGKVNHVDLGRHNTQVRLQDTDTRHVV